MAKRNPFARYSLVDDSNFLRVHIEWLKDEANQDQIERALDVMQEVKTNLEIAERIGRLNEIGARVYYQSAVQWLNSQTPLSTWNSVPELQNAKLTEVDEATANGFEAHVQNTVSALRGESLYAQIELAAAINSNTTKERIKKAFDEVVGEVEDQSTTLEQDFTQKLSVARTEAINQISASATGAVETIKGELNTATSQFRQAQVLDDWAREYEIEVESLEKKLYGEQWKLTAPALSHRVLPLNKPRPVMDWSPSAVTYRGVVGAGGWLLAYPFKALWVSARIAGIITPVAWSKISAVNNQRILAFATLALFALFFAVSSFVGAYGIESIGVFDTKFLTNAHDQEWYVKLTVYIPMIVLLGLAYSFAVKNYRIYANMLDQYKHRRVVASTSRGIILSLDGAEENKVRDTVAAAAAQALFEHRNTGHLTKKEAESLSVLDMARLFTKS